MRQKNEELKAQYEKDVESLNGTGKNAYRLYADVNVQATEPHDFEHYHYNRLPNADKIILEWQRAKYYEDSEWHPRPWELWQYKDDSGEWVTLGRAPGWYTRIHYRRRPDAPTREQWEAEHCKKCGEKWESHDFGVPMPQCQKTPSTAIGKAANKCATCRHKYEPKPRTIHVRMQFPDGKLYEADLPEPMREAPGMGEVYHIVFNDMSKFLFTWVNNEKEKRWLKQGMIHRTEADAQVWVDFFKQWRNDK